jgi:hypothetical protein
MQARCPRAASGWLMLIYTCHTMPMLRPCCAHAALCHGLEKSLSEWYSRGMARVNQAWLHCVNHIGKTQSTPLAAQHGRGTAWCV